ncbi:MAG: hypothetical protein P4L79_07955 [Legionella sp.]|uniref:hypothetical protein n=1 Tax=Legionella sp. TaxID=459 RepID=UPI00284A37F4|nr:hypothetical protein [Legionella sp.]
MAHFFSFPPEILIEIYQKTPPKELFSMLESGDRRVLVNSDAIIKALFMQKTDTAKSYQEKIIQSWLESRTTYPFPFAKTNCMEFFEALKGLDVPYQIAGLHVLNQFQGLSTIDNNAQIHKLLTQLVEDICQGLTGKEKMLALFSSKLHETHINTLLAWIQNNLSHKDARIRGKALKALIALAPELNETHIAPFSDLLRKNLLAEESEGYRMQDSDLHTKALIALIPKLNQAQIHELLGKTMYSKDGSVRHSVQQALIILAPKLDKVHITSFCDWIQENLNHENDAARSKVVQFLIALAPILNETQISRLIAKIQNNLNNKDTTIIYETLKALILMAPKLNETDITTLLPEIQHTMTHEQPIVRDEAQQVVIAMMPKLDETNIPTFLTWVENNLNSRNASLRISALKLFNALVPNLNETHISPSLNTAIQKALNDKIYFVRDQALLASIALALKLNKANTISALIDAIQNHLNGNPHHMECEVPLVALKTLASRLNGAYIPTTFLTWIQNKLNRENDWMNNHINAVLINLTPNLNEEHISNFLIWIKTNLDNGNAWMSLQALKALTILKPRLNETHIIPLLTLIQSKLNDEDSRVKTQAKYSLMVLMPKLSEMHITLPLITEIQNNLSHMEEGIRKCALATLCSLAPKLNETLSSSLLDEIQDKLGSSLKPEPALGRFLSIVCAPTDPHTKPIIEKLVAITANSTEESDHALNILRTWGLSWMQDIEKGENIDECKLLINSLSFTNLQSFHLNSSVNTTLCALQEQWATRLKAAPEEKQKLSTQPIPGN